MLAPLSSNITPLEQIQTCLDVQKSPTLGITILFVLIQSYHVVDCSELSRNETVPRTSKIIQTFVLN